MSDGVGLIVWCGKRAVVCRFFEGEFFLVDFYYCSDFFVHFLGYLLGWGR